MAKALDQLEPPGTRYLTAGLLPQEMRRDEAAEQRAFNGQMEKMAAALADSTFTNIGDRGPNLAIQSMEASRNGNDSRVMNQFPPPPKEFS